MQVKMHQLSAPFKHLFQQLKRPSIRTTALLFAVGIGLSVAIPVCAMGTSSLATQREPNNQQLSQGGNVKLTLVSYSVTEAAYNKIIPKFVAKWKREKNQNVVISESYGGSGAQARAVIDGLEADIVTLSLAPDVTKIQQAGLIKAGWERKAPNGGIVTRSVIALETRPGNPKKITGWQDLAKPGVKVITANPKTSGGARWNFLGLWGSVSQNGGNDSKARQFVSQVFRNVPIFPRDARAATETFFRQGQGDVLINYENEAIFVAQRGQSKSTVVIPQVNISIDNPIAVVDKYVDKHKTRAVAEAFVKYLYTPEAQREFASVGFRPVDATVAKETASKFPRVSKLFTVSNLGGWGAVDRKFFANGAIFDQILAARR